jgi:hypothetical protein
MFLKPTVMCNKRNNASATLTTIVQIYTHLRRSEDLSSQARTLAPSHSRVHGLPMRGHQRYAQYF